MILRSVAAVSAWVGAAICLWAADGSWTSSADGDWSVAGNWEAATPAGGAGFQAWFTNVAPGTVTVNNDNASLGLLGVTLGGNGFTLAGNTLTLDGAGFITALGSSHTLRLPLVLTGATAVTAAQNQTLTLGGAVSGAGGLTLNGGRIVMTNANSYAGVTTNQTGVLEVTTFDALGVSSADPANLVLGKGAFRYAGAAPATMSRGFTIRTSGNNAACVFDLRTNATFAGKSVSVTGPVVKTGPGTLTYAYPGYQTMNQGASGVNSDSPLVVDANGNAGTNGYHGFSVAEGRILFNTPGQTNRFNSNVTIGVRAATAGHFELDDGVVQVPDTWFSISRGNGTNGAPLSSTATVAGGRLELWGLVMAFAAGAPSFNSLPVLTQTGGEIVIAGDAYITETSGGNSTINLRGGKLTCNGTSQGFALNVWNNASVGATLNVSDSAQAYFAKLAVRNLATLSVTNGGTVGVRSTPSSNGGTVVFDNGTLTTYAPANQACDWFLGQGSLKVRAGGLNASVPAAQYAYLGTTPAADPASPGGKITKTGAGTLALYNCEMPVDVNAGRLRLMGGHLTTNKVAKTLTLQPGAELELAERHAAEADTLAVGGAGLVLTPPSLTARGELWQVNSNAVKRLDGPLQLTAATASVQGSAFMNRRKSVTNAWQATFSVAAWGGRTFGNQGEGVAFVLQNDGRGTAAVGKNGSDLGYAGAGYAITNSFAVGLDITNRRLRFGTNGVFGASYDLSGLANLGADRDKTWFTVAYDGSGSVSCTLRRGTQTTATYSCPVNLQAMVGGPEAYLGFTAATGTRYEQYMVDDFSFSAGAPAPAYGQCGGRVTLAAGQALSVALAPAAEQNGFGLGQLTYADGSVLDIRQPVVAVPPMPSLIDQGAWRTNGYASWKPDGRLAVSKAAQNSSGAAYCTNLYPVTGSWSARFGYDIGVTSAPPADGFSFTLQTMGPGDSHTVLTGGLKPAFSIAWRYYDGSIRTTGIRMTTNDVHVISSYDISPVDLVKNGHADITVAYDAPSRQVTVTTAQAAGTNVTVYTGVDILSVLGTDRAYVGFTAYTGGSFAENLIGNFTFQTADPSAAARPGFLAVGAASGSGTLVKRGNAALGIQDGPANPFTNAAVRLDAGGLVLRKAVCEPVTLGDDFYLSRWASWAPGGALQTMFVVPSTAGNATTAARHAVAQPWTARFTFFVGARNSAADGFSFFVHNDPRGPAAIGDAFASAAYAGTAKITQSVALGWNFYEGNSMSNTVQYGQGGDWYTATRRSNLPIKITTIQLETDMVVRHDPAAKTLELTMTQGTNTYATTFTGVDLRSALGGDLGYIGFGSGCGGAQCETRVKDFRFTLDAPTNPLPVVACLGTALFPAGSTNTVTLDTAVSNSAFLIGAAQVGDGATVGLESANANGGALTLAGATLAGGAAFQVGAGTALVVTNLTGGADVTKSGAGTLALAGAAATYAGDTRLAAGTLALDAPRLPEATDLRVTGGATLNLAFVGKQYVHALFVDGAAMPGGQYTAAKAAWITGPGTLVVTYPPVGTTLFVR